MSPAQIEILLWYYVRGEDHPRVKQQPVADFERNVIAEFYREDLMTSCSDGQRLHKLTFRGDCYVGLLLSVQPPTTLDVVRAFTAANGN